MDRHSRKRPLAMRFGGARGRVAAVVALLCAGVGGCTRTDTPTTGEPESTIVEALDDTHPARGKVSDRFPNIALRTQFGEEVRFFDDVIQDRIVLVNFMYTTCTGI